MGKNAGFCYGVERAVNGTKEEINSNAKVYCLGEIVHNKDVVDELKKLGVIFIDNIEQADAKTIIRAHGVSKKVYERAKEINIELKDLTCPSVLKIHKIADDYAKKGFFIILVGKQNHPEVLGIESYCGDKYKIISSKDEIEQILNNIKNEKNIALISQTTYSSKKFDEIASILKEKISNDVNFEIKKTICPSTEIRQKETERIAKNVDLMIIIGDKKSSNTNKLYEISCNYCKNVIFIANSSEMKIDKLENINKVGIMAGASTPKKEILNVKKLIECNL